MSERKRGMDVISDLQERVLRLEGLYSVIDLLGLPGLLAGGAAKVFDTTQTAESLGDQAQGFFPKERTVDGLPIRWTRHPEAADLCIPALEGYPFRLELTVLSMPHIQAADDLVLTLSDVGPVVFGSPVAVDSGATVFIGEFTSSKSGLLTASITSRTYLESAGKEHRHLGVPFVSLRSFPFLPAGVGDGR